MENVQEFAIVVEGIEFFKCFNTMSDHNFKLAFALPSRFIAFGNLSSGFIFKYINSNQ